jgi:predicted acyl esterase
MFTSFNAIISAAELVLFALNRATPSGSPLRSQSPATSFLAGHRSRVDTSTSNFPRFNINSKTGELFGRHTYTSVARNTVYPDRSRPSHIVLPVIDS